MKKIFLAASIIGFLATMLLPGVISQSSEESQVSVEVEESCAISIYNFEQPGMGEHDPKIIGEGQSDYFSGTVSNTGNFDAYVNFSLNVFAIDENGTLEQKNTTDQPGNYSQSFELPSTTIDENNTQFKDFITEFNATYEPGDYIGQAKTEYECEEENGTTRVSRPFIIISALGIGEGDRPDDVGDDDDVDFQLDLDALIEALNQTSDLDTNTTEMENASLDLNALIEDLIRTGQIDTDVNRTENASLDADSEQSAEDSEPREGDSDAPGQTPQPEPDPQPLPLLSLSIKPLDSTYEAPRGRFSEIELELENIGEETLNDLTLEPRFSDGMDWEAQSVNIDSLSVGDTVNETVYVNPGESVTPGVYQVPVYGSNPEADINMQYVTIEVTEELVTESLRIDEAPQNIRFERGKNYTVPVLLQNMGPESLEDVEIELQNTENCGAYEVDTIDEIEPGSTASVSVRFTASTEMNECSATVVASSGAGNFAFSEMRIETVEEMGIVPEEFRIPIVASLWTLMLLAYAVLTKRYGIHNMTVKMPLVLLVVGEAFIIIYLSSVYYNVLPPGLLPF